MKTLKNNIDADVEVIKRIPVTDLLLEVICRTTGMGFAAIARVTQENWVACSVRDEIEFGLKPGDELKLETTICNEIRQSHEPVVIDNVADDDVYKNHPTAAMYGFQSYISVPIFRKDGSFFGTLCAIDPEPAKINTKETIGMFKMFADLISFHMHAIEEINFSQIKIAQDRKTSELREQFIAILGHDLRNPVSAIANSAELLRMISNEEDVHRIANIIKNSTYRMSALIKNMLDFASGRMGGGIPLQNRDKIFAEQILKEVISEINAIWPDQKIDTLFNISEPVNADGNRIAQLFSNLLRNAVIYGKPHTTILVEAFTQNNNFKLLVTNEGQPIPAEAMDQLFQPFSRGKVQTGLQGLGLGLYIASEIAKAHDGKLEVISNEAFTRFILTIPLY